MNDKERLMKLLKTTKGRLELYNEFKNVSEEWISVSVVHNIAPYLIEWLERN